MDEEIQKYYLWELFYSKTELADTVGKGMHGGLSWETVWQNQDTVRENTTLWSQNFWSKLPFLLVKPIIYDSEVWDDF